jgi:hypothetical protein
VRLGSRLAFALALVIAGCGGGSHDTHPAPSTTRTRSTVGTRARAGSVRATQLPPRDPVLARLGLPALHDHSPLPGYLLIADRDNNRIIIVNPSGRIVWRFPQGGALASGQEFAGPDDAYMVHGNEIQVADIINCRVLWLGQDRQIVHAIGTAGDCVHDPPHALLAPNGDTPLPDGGVLVTEIGGWVDRFTPGGKLVWSIKTPTDYPSDAQLLPDGDTLVAGYNDPGRIDVITPAGHIAWTYGPPSGPGSLNQPSLAVQLPNGLIAATDDWNERVVVIDPRLHRIVWQYGHDHVAGSAPGYLRKPDGLDLVP